jgi:hypothetical protein
MSFCKWAFGALALISAASPALPQDARSASSQLVPRASEKPSFDCAQAKTAAARLICADGELTRLDGQLGIVFQRRKARIAASDQSKFVADQLAWIRARNNRCDLDGKANAAIELLASAKPCMANAIRERIAVLDQTASSLGPRLAPTVTAPPTLPVPNDGASRATIRAMHAGAIEMTGEVSPGDDARFKSIISMMQNGGIVFLESPGGNPFTAMAIGRLIRARGFDTYITAGTCASACGIIWLAGVRRGIGPTGRVGFHAAYNGVTHEQSGFANALIGAYLNELHLSDQAIIYITHAAPTEMQWLTAADATAVGILADLEAVLSNGTTPSPGTYEREWVNSCIDATRQEASQKKLADGVIYGFCGCVAKRVIKTVTAADLTGPRPRPKVVAAFDYRRMLGCRGDGDWLGFCPAVSPDGHLTR